MPRRRIVSTEELYDDLVEHIEEVYSELMEERGGTNYSGTLDPHLMLDLISEQAMRTQKHYNETIKQAQKSINYNFETIGMILKAAAKK